MIDREEKWERERRLRRCFAPKCLGLYESVSCSELSNSLQLHELWPTRLLCPWNSPGKNTGMGSHFLLQGIFLTQGLILGLLHSRQIPYHLSYREVPIPWYGYIYISFPLGWKQLWVEWLNRTVSVCLTLSAWEFQFLHCSANTYYGQSLSHSNGCLIVILISIPLMPIDIELLFMCLFAIWISSLVKSLLKCLACV